MNKYISILRGINVSGQKKIIMTDLKLLYEQLNFQNVATYIQSGNVIFSTTSKNAKNIKLVIEKAIEEKYKFYVPVVVRTHQEIKAIISNSPFTSVDLIEDGTKMLVTFLSSESSEANIANLQKFVIAPEKLVIKRKEVYLYCPNGYGKSKLSNTFLEKKLNVTATTRNWKSVHKLYELSI